MTLPYRRSAGADPCRWPIPDATEHCTRCGWPLVTIKAYSTVDGVVAAHYRHRKPDALARRHPDTSSNPHESRPTLTLSEVVPRSASTTDAQPSTNPTGAAQGTYPHQRDITWRRGGAGDRLLIPTLDEWAAWKAAVA